MKGLIHKYLYMYNVLNKYVFYKLNFFKSSLQICKYCQSIGIRRVKKSRIGITVSVSVVNMVSVHNNNVNLTINLCIEFSVETAVFLYCCFSDNITLNYKV